MSLIDRTGTFRGNILDHHVSKSSGGFPQWVAALQGAEFWDETEKVWVPWADVEERDITGYFILYGSKNKKTLSAKQLEKVTDWSGKTFTELENLDLSQLQVQFRVGTNEYEGNVSMQVEWIDTADATPGRTVRALEAPELAALDAQYATIMEAGSGGATPAKAPDKPKDKPKIPVKKVEAKGKVEVKTKNTVTKVKPAAKLTATQAQAETAQAKPAAPATGPPDLPTGHHTKDEAWGNCVDLKDKDCSDQKLAQAWVAAAEKVAGKGIADADVTDEQWFQIEQLVLAATAAF